MNSVDMLQLVLPDVTVQRISHVSKITMLFGANMVMYPLETSVSVRSASFVLTISLNTNV